VVNGVPKERIREALDELLSWPAISRSPQLARFLSYIVEAAMRGEEGGIKAYAIAVDVFGRPQSFDPQSDPIVRVQARRLRSLLDRFYDEGHSRTNVRIRLPVGRYVPEFTLSGTAGGRPEAPEALARAMAELPLNAGMGEGTIQTGATPRPAPRPRISMLGQATIAGTVVLAIGLSLLLFLRQAGPPLVAVPEMPVVATGEFVDLSGRADLNGLGTRIAEQVRADLEPFEDMALAPAGEAPSADGYLLGGVIHPAAQGIEIVASLTAGEATLWSGTYLQPLPSGGNNTEIAKAVAFAIAREVGPFRGPLHERGRKWLDERARPLTAVNAYVCLLSYRLARETGNSSHIADALVCQEKLLETQPDVASALSASAWLETRAVINRALPDQGLNRLLEDPLARAERALTLAPQSSLVHEHLGIIRNWRRELDLAQQNFVQALRLNPLNTDARAGYAITLARARVWELAGEQAAIAIRDTPFPSPWYFYPAALNAYRDGRYDEAIELGQRAAVFGGGEVGSLLAVAAAVELNRSEVIEPLLPRILGMESLRRAGIMTWMAGQVTGTALLERMSAALTRAGIPAAALTEAF
jgi:tetratricopeptide (TPR) repeat protein